MNELIKINDDNTINGRELYEFLQVETPYHKWFPRMCEYGFTEGVDFNTDKNVRVQNEGGRQVSREVIDHTMTISMAKEISMLQRNERGKQARLYFIEVENRWNSPEHIMARALKIANKELDSLRAANAEMKPKALFADSVSTSHTEILVGELAKLIKQNGVDMGEKRLFAWLRENGYLVKRKGTDWNMPSQYSLERGLFRIKETTVNHSDGHTTITKTPKVTGKGQIYFINKFLGGNGTED